MGSGSEPTSRRGPRSAPLCSAERRSRSNASRCAATSRPDTSARVIATAGHVDHGNEEWAALARADVGAALQGTPLAGTPMIEVSATAKTGLNELVASLDSVLRTAGARRDVGRPRLGIDRAFTLTGFGTVVTGTLVDGALATGDEIEILPSGQRARIRGIQTHKRALDSASPGSRVALNLVGVEKDEIERGMVVVRPGTLAPVSVVSARIEVLGSASESITHDEAVKIHAGTAEVMARVSLLEGATLDPGDTGWAQLRLAAPRAAPRGGTPRGGPLVAGSARQTLQRARRASRRRGPDRRARKHARPRNPRADPEREPGGGVVARAGRAWPRAPSASVARLS